MQEHDCFICRKHLGRELAPPGGYIYEDEHWLVCLAPIDKGPLGTLFIESRRHVLDFADFNDQESLSFAELARKLYVALRPRVGADRIYQVSMMEGVPHFHAWIVPRRGEIQERGVAFLAKDLSCARQDAEGMAKSLRDALK